MPDTPEHVWVFGGDHSPWVQSVLLGLHEKKIAHTVTTVPPLSVFAKSGILMPAAQSDAGPWQLERTFFWIGCVLVWLAFPLALAATLFFTVRISRKNLR